MGSIIANIVSVAVVLVIVGLIVWYIIRTKKKGKKCIGCPYSSCPSRNKGGDGCGCSGNSETNS